MDLNLQNFANKVNAISAAIIEAFDFTSFVNHRDINQQYMGAWLNPNTNSLRICFTTEILNKYESPEHPNPDTFPSGYKISS